jgi:hypothetical protein
MRRCMWIFRLDFFDISKYVKDAFRKHIQSKPIGWVTRINLDNVHAWGLQFMREEGSGELGNGQTKTRAHESLPRFGPPEGKDLRPACVTLYWRSVTVEVLQWRHWLDLAEGGELSKCRALRWRWKKGVRWQFWRSLPAFYNGRLGLGILSQVGYNIAR